MTAGTAAATTDRSDFRTVVVGGAKLGVVTALGVIVYVLVTKIGVGPVRQLLQSLVVIATAGATTLLPAQWTTPRGADGIAGAATLGFVGTVAFMALDIVVLRPLNHVVTIYPWTWDALGGGSSWWYLPVWWMLGTYVAWMGAMLVAGRAARGETALPRLATPLGAGTLILALLLRLAPLGLYLPVAFGAAFTFTLTVLAVVAIARKA